MKSNDADHTAQGNETVESLEDYIKSVRKFVMSGTLDISFGSRRSAANPADLGT
jgi:hypothetical protein